MFTNIWFVNRCQFSPENYKNIVSKIVKFNFLVYYYLLLLLLDTISILILTVWSILIRRHETLRHWSFPDINRQRLKINYRYTIQRHLVQSASSYNTNSLISPLSVFCIFHLYNHIQTNATVIRSLFDWTVIKIFWNKWIFHYTRLCISQTTFDKNQPQFVPILIRDKLHYILISLDP